MRAGPRDSAEIRSPAVSAPTYSAPRWLATVSPDPSNDPLLTTVAVTPARCARVEDRVVDSATSRGSTSASQRNASSSRSVPGIRDVKPTMPCDPGGSPVPRLVMLVAVVDGTPHVSGSLPGQRPRGRAPSSAMVVEQTPAQPVDEEHHVRRRRAAGRAGWPSRGRRVRPSPRQDVADRSRAVTRQPTGALTVGAQDSTVAALRAPGELEHRVDCLRTVGARTDPQREVLGGQRAGVAVVGDAVGVAAGRGLEVDAAYGAPPDGQHGLGHVAHCAGCDGRRRVGDHPGHRDAADAVERDGLGRGRGVRLRAAGRRAGARRCARRSPRAA